MWQDCLTKMKREEGSCVRSGSDKCLCGLQMNEEELYSSVARGDAGDEENSSKIDAANNATFGAAEESGVDADDGDAASTGKGAWGNAGAGVAAVKGGTRCAAVIQDAVASCLGIVEAGAMSVSKLASGPNSIEASIKRSSRFLPAHSQQCATLSLAYTT